MTTSPSFPRKRESMSRYWTPAFAGVTLALLAALPAFADPGTMARSSTLRAEPHFDAAEAGSVDADVAVDIVGRSGGWYQLKAPGGKTGWTRMSTVRLSESSSSTVFGKWAGLFESGRSSNTRAAATTGVRGLDEQDLANAQPNFQALDSLNQYASSSGDATHFAAQLKLQATNLPLEK